jgi:hypothetical protein
MPRTAKVNEDRKRYRRIYPGDGRYDNQPHWIPEQWQLDMVHRLAGLCLPTVHIAKLIGCDVDMLHRECQHELELGIAEANALVLHKTFYKIVSEGDGQMIRFYLARRLGWLEPKSEDAKLSTELSELSDEELRAELGALITRTRTATATRGLEPPMSG